ncbi:hypothetical protein GCM10010517_29450 [Streptosporangium fragile]|uniref:Transcriptional regulator SbtR-like C-terminal domain-containing protein n=1 Tax=Streptosporangium fragile TaxID=46186 RepID=A0ABP6IFT4_9ACTN
MICAPHVFLAAEDAGAETTKARTDIAEAVSTLLTRARDAGAARSELDGRDVLKPLCGLRHAIAAAGDDQTAAAERFLAVILPGLGLPTGQDATTAPPLPQR